MDKFGWFYGRNGTTWSDGEILMDTGVNDINHLGDIKIWNGRNKGIENQIIKLKEKIKHCKLNERA